MSPQTRLFVEIAIHTTTIALFIASLACLLFGIALVLRREAAAQFGAYLNRWVSSRRALRSLEVSREIQRSLYRRHRWVGAFLVLGSCYVLYFLQTGFTAEPFVLVFRKSAAAAAIPWVLESSWWIILVTNILGFVIGVIMFVRPSSLKGIEAWANKTYSPREGTRIWETMHLRPDRIAQEYPAIFGWLIIAGSLYSAFNLGLILLGWRWR